MTNISIIILPVLVAFIATLVATPVSLIFIRKFGIFDDPKKHKHPAIIHKKPVPRAGAIPLFIGIAISAIFFLPITPVVTTLFVASFLALVIGVIDDKYDISPYIRFVSNIIIAGILVGSGIGISFITNPLGGIIHLPMWFASAITLIWIVWVMNMLNWSKGVDGQMPGIVAISAVVIGILSLRFPISEPNTFISSVLAFSIAGGALGFLIYNFYPAKIFPGYGATSVYLLLAAVSVLSGAKLATAILVMGVPMVDGVFTVVRRIINRQSPFQHDKKHLHHLLLRLGFTQKTIALFYWFVSAILGAISLTLSSQGKLFAIIMLAVLSGGALFFLHVFLRFKDEQEVNT